MGTPNGQWPSPRRIGLFVAMLILAGITSMNVVVIWTACRRPESEAATPPEVLRHFALASRALPPSEEAPPAGPGSDDAYLDDEPAAPAPKEPKRAGTVHQASARSCSTSSVDGLSRQIIAQARCIDAHAFVPVPARPNLVARSHVFLYMEASARDRLISVLDAHPDRTMTVNSSLRTVAQQYLVWRWAASKRCGVQLATPPGESNHETGLALDILDASKWRSALEASDFHWLGAIDKVHFDYKGNSALPHNLDVMAFQQLWNRVHPEDTIEETGRYSAATEQRLKQSPAAGFPVEPRCDQAHATALGSPRSRAR